MKLCIIPARGGSKRIPGKNIKEFNGKPIIAYSIEAALKCGCFDDIIVSTDSNEIAELSRSYGAEVPFLRPVELSDDFTGTMDVIKHAVQWFQLNRTEPDYVCCLYATAPFIKAQFLDDAFQLMIREGSDYCFSVTSFPFPIQRAVTVTQNNRVKMLWPEHFHSRSQDLDECYHDAGQFYWGTSRDFIHDKQLFSDAATPYILPRYLVQDIDTAEDWLRAELMHQALINSGELD